MLPPTKLPPQSSPSFSYLEFLSVFLIGSSFMIFFYLAPTTAGDPGVPGHDSFYHIRMATLIPQYGLLDNFPWLQYCWFTQDGTFVSHHYGFHLLLLPFVTLSEWVHDDALVGGRWAMTFFFGLSLALFHLILGRSGVRWRWVWIVLLLLMPPHFFGRHAFVRAIAPALAFVMLILALLYERRYGWLAIVIAAFNHLYLGAVLYSPVLIGLHSLACCVGEKSERRIPWKLIGFSTAGWTLGVLTYPYSEGMIEFLTLQVLGTGLSPDIEVGTEWKPYSGVWAFAKMTAIILLPWLAVMALRLRIGPRLSTNELSSILIATAFLILTLKARRFMEYWPLLGMLSTALLSSPLIDRFNRWIENVSLTPARSHFIRLGMSSTLLVAMIVLAGRSSWNVESFAKHGLVWAALATIYVASQLHFQWRGSTNFKWGQFVLWSLLFAVGAVGLFTMIYRPSGTPEILRSPLGNLSLTIAVALALASMVTLSIWPKSRREDSFLDKPLKSLATVMTGLAALATMATVGAEPMQDRQSEIRCGYDLAKTKAAMEFLKSHSEPGDIVFTDDWDIFPLYFYYNTHNHFIVGLDPKFTHHRDPELWERYIKVSRGEVPSSITVDSEGGKRRVEVRIEDIRDKFSAKFAIVDSDHKKLARALSDSGDFAKLIYPAENYSQVANEPYLIFRISGDPPAAPKGDSLFLSRLTPSWYEQGWGNLSFDHSVSGSPLSIGESRFTKGLGTHAPSRIDFEIPDGFERFVTKVGLDSAVAGQGSVEIRILLDGEVSHEAFLSGEAESADLELELGGASTLSLVALATADGNRFDHVNWAMARLIR